ncbi:MAG: LysR family transcriptional regulator [Alphaproteobacteria bacterium]|nr:LysR family transcriptional regulator [Alphaproteobacteria bacterium]
MRNLPSLNGLRAFEAAGRLGSFAAAAAELNVTQTAVSRLVKALEARLGFALFSRRANALVLTDRGAALLPGLTAAFDDMARSVGRVRSLSQALTVAAGPSFAMRWLIPRLAHFQAAQPSIEVRLVTASGLANDSTPFGDDWTAAIRLGNGDWDGLEAARLFDADLFPVCAPSLAGQFRKPADLMRLPLLRVTSAPEDWPIWLKAAGLRSVQAKGPRFDYDAFALQAAIDGLGVALAHRPYVADDLAAGRLVMPFDIVAARGLGWYLVHRSMAANAPEHTSLKLFRGWLLEQAAGERRSLQHPALTRGKSAARVGRKARPTRALVREGNR